MNACMHARMHARTHAWTHTHTHTQVDEAAAKKAQMAREKQEKVMPHTQQTYIIPEDVCACVCMCVCVFVTARFSQVAKQEERLHEEGRVSLAPSLGQVSTIVSALDVCMNVLYGSVYACMHACIIPKLYTGLRQIFPQLTQRKLPQNV